MPRIHLRSLNDAVDVPAPPSPARLDQLLPALHILDDRVISAALQRQGWPVTCAAGCSACCEVQAVPVTPAEAYAVFLLVEELPEPRRSAVLARFADLEERLDRAGLAEPFLQGRRPLDDGTAQAEARRYISLRLVCPFLEDHNCSIYHQRPFACREYYVTSPAELCSTPFDSPVNVVADAGPGFDANLAAVRSILGPDAFTVPLALALAYVKRNRDVLEATYPGIQVFSAFVTAFVARIRISY